MQVEVQSSNYQTSEIKIEQYSKEYFESKLDRSLKDIAENEGFVVYKIDKRLVSADGGNYLGVLYEVDVTGKTKEGNKVLHIFVKNIIELGSFKILSMDSIFNIELFAYKMLSKLFTELHEEANVPHDVRYKMLKAFDQSTCEAIIMENLDKKGFKTCHRMDAMSYKLVELSVIELAKFLALSFVIKEKRPDFFEKKIKTLKNPFIYDDNWNMLIDRLRDTAVENANEDFKDNIFKGFSKERVQNFVQFMTSDTGKSCLCHGDYRANNIMVKKSEGEIQEILPVDYQLMHYNTPIYDFLYLIITGTDREFRQAHLEDMKNLYHNTFSNYLAYFDLDANVIYSRKAFEKEYEERLGDGLIIALLLMPYVLASETDVPDMTKDKSEISFAVDGRFKERLQGIIQDYVDWGVI